MYIGIVRFDSNENCIPWLDILNKFAVLLVYYQSNSALNSIRILIIVLCGLSCWLVDNFCFRSYVIYLTASFRFVYLGFFPVFHRCRIFHLHIGKLIERHIFTDYNSIWLCYFDKFYIVYCWQFAIKYSFRLLCKRFLFCRNGTVFLCILEVPFYFITIIIIPSSDSFYTKEKRIFSTFLFCLLFP